MDSSSSYPHSKKAVQPNGYTALIHQLFSSEWQ